MKLLMNVYLVSRGYPVKARFYINVKSFDSKKIETIYNAFIDMMRDDYQPSNRTLYKVELPDNIQGFIPTMKYSKLKGLTGAYNLDVKQYSNEVI